MYDQITTIEIASPLDFSAIKTAAESMLSVPANLRISLSRFMTYVEVVPSGCWEWRGGRNHTTDTEGFLTDPATTTIVA